VTHEAFKVLDINHTDAAQNCAIQFVDEAYRGDVPMVVGRQSAGAGFLDSFVRYADVDSLQCFSATSGSFDAFVERTRENNLRNLPQEWIKPRDFEKLTAVGNLYIPGPILSEACWERRIAGERKYSICGLTHSLAPEYVVRDFRELLTAPTQAWDALICTSKSAKSVVQNMFSTWSEYLESRSITIGKIPIQLPIIPLGVDVKRFKRTSRSTLAGKALRERLGINTDDIVVLASGRLDFLSKSHPAPLSMAMKLAQAKCPNKTLHLLFSGQLGGGIHEHEFSAVQRTTHVQWHFVDGNVKEDFDASWQAADVFVSLSDNIQESFGLTPVEAMAAALPCVVSDWNGHRDNIIDGVTGFLVPTMTPAQDVGVDLANLYSSTLANHMNHIGITAQFTAVDIDACGQAIARLANKSDLRLKMGRAGRQRAETVYSWKSIIPQYQDLWAELHGLRKNGMVLGERDPSQHSTHPDYPSPFRIFKDHPSRQLLCGDAIEVAQLEASELFDEVSTYASYSLVSTLLLGKKTINLIIEELTKKPHTMKELEEVYAPGDWGSLVRTIMWLYKFGIVRVR